MAEEPHNVIKIFYCYAHEDKALRDQLERHLFTLKRSGQISDWYDREIPPGTEWEPEIDSHLDTADIVLLLISSDFMSSDYCYGKEMQRALERYREGKCRVIPIILRPVLLRGTFISELQQLPSEGKAVTIWSNFDEAFEDVAIGIFNIIEQMREVKVEQFRIVEVERAKKASEKIIRENKWRNQKKQQRNELLQKKMRNRSPLESQSIEPLQQALPTPNPYQENPREDLWLEDDENLLPPPPSGKPILIPRTTIPSRRQENPREDLWLEDDENLLPPPPSGKPILIPRTTIPSRRQENPREDLWLEDDENLLPPLPSGKPILIPRTTIPSRRARPYLEVEPEPPKKKFPSILLSQIIRPRSAVRRPSKPTKQSLLQKKLGKYLFAIGMIGTSVFSWCFFAGHPLGWFYGAFFCIVGAIGIFMLRLA